MDTFKYNYIVLKMEINLMKNILVLAFLLVLSYCGDGNFVKGSNNFVLGSQNKVVGNSNQQVTYNVNVQGNNNNIVGANYRLNGNNIKMYGVGANTPITQKVVNPNSDAKGVVSESFGTQRQTKSIDQVRGIIPNLLQNNPEIMKRLELLANFAEFLNLFSQVRDKAVSHLPVNNNNQQNLASQTLKNQADNQSQQSVSQIPVLQQKKMQNNQSEIKGK